MRGGNSTSSASVEIPKTRPVDKAKSGGSEAKPADTVNTSKQSESQVEGSKTTDVTTEVYQTTQKVEPQRGPTTSTSSRSAKAKAIRQPTTKASIRDFPVSLLSIAKAEFPGAKNQTDALAAYVYVKSGKKVDISDDVQALVDNWDGDNTIFNLEKRVGSMEKLVREIKNMMDSLNLLMSFIAFDRLGYRQEQPRSPRDVNLLENGVEDLMVRVDELADAKRKHDAVKNGPPIR